jgi:hypothetical protein
MNKLYRLPLGAAFAAAALFALPTPPAPAQTVSLVVVDMAVVAQGYRASKLINTSVTNDSNERIGTLDDIVIGQDRILFAILQVGGFLGIGGKLVVAPYQALQISDDGRKVVLPGASKDELKKLPEFKYH